MGQTRANEFAGNREYQAGLNLRIKWAEKIRKRQARYGVGKRRHRDLHSVPRKIGPFQKVSDLVSPNTQGDFQHFQTADFLAKRRIKTRATLFDISEVKGRNIRDRLDMIVTRKVGVGSTIEIGVVSGNGGDIIECERLGESGAQIWIGCTAVANEPAGVDVEMHEVREALDAC